MEKGTLGRLDEAIQSLRPTTDNEDRVQRIEIEIRTKKMKAENSRLSVVCGDLVIHCTVKVTDTVPVAGHYDNIKQTTLSQSHCLPDVVVNIAFCAADAFKSGAKYRRPY